MGSGGSIGNDGNEGILGARIRIGVEDASVEMLGAVLGVVLVLGHASVGHTSVGVLGVLGVEHTSVEDWRRVRESGVSGVSR